MDDNLKLRDHVALTLLPACIQTYPNREEGGYSVQMAVGLAFEYADEFLRLVHKEAMLSEVYLGWQADE